MTRKLKAGGGMPAIIYTVNKAMEVGPLRLWRRMRSRNACKTCAVGMGGMAGGMVNEAGHFPEVCKKSLQAQVADMVGALPADYFDTRTLEQLKQLTPKQAEDAGRLSYPAVLAPGADKFQPASWDSVMAAAAHALDHVDPQKVAFYASGRSSNEAAFLLQSFARVYGTNHVMNCSFYCHQASGVALKKVFGTGTAMVTLEDMTKCDLVFLIGANPASNHPRLMTQLANLRARGGKVVVVNPILETGLRRFHVPSQVKSLIFGSEIASLYVQPLAGGDVGFLVGVLKALLETNKIDQQFLASHAQNAEYALEHARQISWEQIVTNGGVDKETIEKTAAMLAESKSTIFAWAMGLTHHTWGVDNILALCNIAVATGHCGRPGAGMMPIRGHSNVQGVGSVGFTPELQAAVKNALERVYATTLPETPGYDTHAMMMAAERGEIETLIVLGGNLWGSNPDSDWAERAMQKIKTIVYMSTKLNPGHFYGHGETTIILPVLARDEEPQSTTQESMFNFVRMSEGGQPNVAGQMRAESEVICDLANRVLGDKPVNWNRLRSHHEVRQVIAEVIPGWREIGKMDETSAEFNSAKPNPLSLRQSQRRTGEITISGRIFHQPKFNTPSGRAIMHVTPLPDMVDPDALRLITLRSEGQFNTVVYEEYDIYRGMPHRHCILLSRADVDRLHLRDGQRVKVRGEAGKLENIEVVVGDIRNGVAAMFYPESNVLISARLDPQSKTPAFKCAPIWIEA
jgi:molybdopterin-dependent oxidoreductase alpha subunit